MTTDELKNYLDHAKNFVGMAKVVAMMTATKTDDVWVAKADAALHLLTPFASEEWMVADLKSFWKTVLAKIESVNPEAASDLKTIFGEGV